MGWFLENKEWIFSGAGVAIFLCLIRIFKKKRSKRQSFIRQNQSGGAGSNNIQIGSINIGHKND